jgi:hypothetical protein
MPQDLLSSLPVAPELLVAGFGLLLVFLFLRRVTRALGLRRAAAQARYAAGSMQGEADAEDDDATHAEAEADLPGVLYPMPVISRAEERYFDLLEEIVRDAETGHRVMTQVSLNAFLYGGVSGRSRAQDPTVIRQLGELRVDFLIVDADWGPVLALDLERGEFSSSPIEERTMRALERAGIAHLTLATDGLSDMQRDEIKRQLASVQGVAAE